MGHGREQLGFSHDHSHFAGLRCSPRAGPCGLQDMPHLLEQFDAAHYAAVVHVPFVVHRIQSLNLVY